MKEEENVRKKRIAAVILSFMLAMSLTVTSFAADIPQNAEVQTGSETTVEGGTADLENIQGEEGTVSSEDEEAPVVETPDTVEESTGEQETDETDEGNVAVASETSSEWTSSDFVYTELSQTLNGCDYTRQFTITGQAIAGFSEAGTKKLENNKNLVLPAVDDKGEKLVGVADGAFKSKELESVRFPEGMMVDYDDTVTNVVTRRGNFIIGSEAFAKNNLKSVYLPEGVIAVMPSAFKNNQLASVSLPHTIWWIENSSFAYNSLTTVGFPKTCDFQVQIHAFAFAHNNIKSVRLPDYTEVVEMKAFYWNPGMEECPADAPDKEQTDRKSVV